MHTTCVTSWGSSSPSSPSPTAVTWWRPSAGPVGSACSEPSASARAARDRAGWIDEHVGDQPTASTSSSPASTRASASWTRTSSPTCCATWCRPATSTSPRRSLPIMGFPSFPRARPTASVLGWTAATAAPQVECALKHEKVRLIANALGTPPPEVVVRRSMTAGRLVAALCGSARQARKHTDAGHRHHHRPGQRGRRPHRRDRHVVLWPEVIDAVAPIPVLAAGGIGSGARSPPRWPWAPRASGPARSG